MSIDLCIVSFNTKDKLKRLLNSIQAPAFFNQENSRVYVADNASTDGSKTFLEMEECVGDFDIDKIFFNENIGFARACNQLAAAGSSDIIGLLNADIWFSPNAIVSIQKSFDDNPGIAILGPKQRNEEGFIVHAGIQGDETTAKPRGWKIHDPDDQHYRHLEDMVSVSGSAYFVRRSVWEDLTACPIYQDLYPGIEGAFLPTPHYFEETFCSYHARAHGYRVFYDGRISIGHSWAASTDGPKPILNQYFLESQGIFRKACDVHRIPHN